jgi:hypothetical protein
MRTKIIVGMILATLGAAGVVQLAGFPEMRYTVHVIGEDGQPISGVKTASLFNKGPVGYGQKMEVPETTDDNGNFTAEGYSDDGVPAGKLLSLDGYYDSGVLVPHFYTSKDGHWQPWDQIYTTVLRKVGTRIPMYVRKVNAVIPSAVGVSCGYDLEEADWVAPYGKGKVADFLMTATKVLYRADNDYEAAITISFSNSSDGMQEIQLPKEFANSVFKWPREAPEDGYQPSLEAHRLWHNIGHQEGTTSIDTSKDHQTYFFRVRTMKQGNRIISALYGKITSGFYVSPDKTGQHGYIEFTYYLNPTALDQNLEFSGDSLFKNLPQDETTHEP